MKPEVPDTRWGGCRRGVPSRSTNFDNFIFKWGNLVHFEGLIMCFRPLSLLRSFDEFGMGGTPGAYVCTPPLMATGLCTLSEHFPNMPLSVNVRCRNRPKMVFVFLVQGEKCWGGGQMILCPPSHF